MKELAIFDFDGVVVETEYSTFRYYKELLADQYNINLKDSDFAFKVGRKSIDFFRDCLGQDFDPALVSQLTEQKRAEFASDIRRYVTLVPSVRELLQSLIEAKVTVALGSQNEKDFILACLKEFQLESYFSLVLGLQDIENKKPNPEIFLAISDNLGIAPSKSVVIEDSVDGLEAANKGGFATIAVDMHRLHESKLKSLAGHYVNHIEELKLEDLIGAKMAA